MNFKESLTKRRSVYQLSNEAVISDEEVTNLVAHSLQYTPSSFNSQSQRVVILFDQKHLDLWNLTKEALKKVVPVADFSKTEEKINSFMAAHGTILFFDDQKTTKGLIEKFPIYKHNFELWYQQQNGMLQSNIWVMLAEKNVGASLQHYNELIEAKVKETFGLPIDWQLIAQMPFGKIVSQPELKPHISISERMLIRK